MTSIELPLYTFYQTEAQIQCCIQTSTKDKQISSTKIQKYSKYQIQKDTKNSDQSYKSLKSNKLKSHVGWYSGEREGVLRTPVLIELN